MHFWQGLATTALGVFLGIGSAAAQPQQGDPLPQPWSDDATASSERPALVAVEDVATEAPVPEHRVAILDLRSSEASAAVARALTVVVTAEVAATPGYRAVSRNDLQAILTHQSDAQLLGCAEVSCMADIAKLAAADLLVAGSVERLDDAYLFSLELIDPAEPRVIERQTATWRGDADRMVELARPYVDRLLSGATAQSFEGALEVVAPDDARIVVDGNDIGSAPLEQPVRRLATGVHRLSVSKPGFATLEQDVVVVRNETSLVRVELVDADSLRPWYSRWWVWGSIGGGLAVVGGTAAAIATFAVLSQPQPTTLDIAAQLPVAP